MQNAVKKFYDDRPQPYKEIWIMNQKQLITMWCGIAAIVLAGLTVIENYGLVCFYGFSVWVLIVALITGGLIYTFKGNDRKVKNTIQDIRDDILKKRRFKMRKNDYDKDK
jgi:Ca2+-dependent lipid-binding protein